MSAGQSSSGARVLHKWTQVCVTCVFRLETLGGKCSKWKMVQKQRREWTMACWYVGKKWATSYYTVTQVPRILWNQTLPWLKPKGFLMVKVYQGLSLISFQSISGHYCSQSHKQLLRRGVHSTQLMPGHSTYDCDFIDENVYLCVQPAHTHTYSPRVFRL